MYWLEIYHNGRMKRRKVSTRKQAERLASLAGDNLYKYHPDDEWYVHIEKIEDYPSCVFNDSY